MRIIDKDDIRIQYEKTLESNQPSDPQMVDMLYTKRLKQLIYFQKKSQFSSIIFNEENEDTLLNDQIKERRDNNLSEPFLEKFSSLKKSVYDKNIMDQLDEEAKHKNIKRGMFSQIFLLTWINMLFHYKQPLTYIMLFGQIVLGNVIFLIVYQNLGDPKDDTIIAIQNRMGLCYLLVMQGTFSGLGSVLLKFINTKKLFKKDKDSRLYDEFPFFVSELSYLLPIYIILFIIVVFFYYFFLGLNQDPSLTINALYTYFFMFIGCFLSGQSFSALLASIADTMATVSIIAPLIIAPLSMSSGYLANLRTSTLPIQVISYISSIRFSFQGFTLTEFQNYNDYVDACMTYVPCDTDPSGKCHVHVPEQSKDLCNPMKVTDFIQNDINTNVYYLLGILVGLRLIAYIIFRIKSGFGKMKYKKNPYLRKKLAISLD